MRPQESPSPASPQGEQQSSLQQAQRKVITPVSSEQSILTEAAAATATPPMQDNATPQPAAPQASISYGQATLDDDTGEYTGSFVAEPLHVDRPANSYSSINATKLSQTSSSSNTPKSSHSAWKWIVAIIFLLGAGVYCYFTFFSTQIFAHDLVEEKTQNTTYLRPRQWSSIGGGNSGAASAFGNMKGASGKSTAAVSIQVDTEHPQTSLTEASVQALRTQFLSMINEEASAHFFQGDGVMCTTPIQMTKKEDTTSTATVYGIYYFTASCIRTNEKQATEVRSRAILGKDGLFRSISVVATEDNWKLNEKTFEKILTSIDQI